jgi:hypothetical protein
MRHPKDADSVLDTAWVELVDVGSAVLTASQQDVADKIRKYFKKHPDAEESGAAIARHIDEDAKKTGTILNALAEGGKLKRKGKNKTRTFRLSSKKTGRRWLNGT